MSTMKSLLLLAPLLRFATSHGYVQPLLRGQDQGTSTRSLAVGDPAMTFVKYNAGPDTVTVKLQQTLFGSESKCGNNASDPEDVAFLMFAIYREGSVGDETCDVHVKKDACWSTEIEVSCDPVTNKAFVDLYTRDLHHLDRRNDQVANPKVPHANGRMCIGPLDTVGFSVKHSAIFECRSEGVDRPSCLVVPCPSDKWCAAVANQELAGPITQTLEPGQSHVCVPFTPVGEECRAPGLIPPQPESRCQADAGVVCAPYTCFGGLTDELSRCVAYEGSCLSTADCLGDTYCNASVGQCMAKFQLGDCCDAITAPCGGILECVSSVGPFGEQSTCQEPRGPPAEVPPQSCVTDDFCPNGQWCALVSDQELAGPIIPAPLPGQTNMCVPYAADGENCRGPNLIPPSPETRCVIGAGECVPFTCVGGMTDPFFRCVNYEGACSSGDDCGGDSYCNRSSGQCMAKFRLGDCCDAFLAPCAGGLECVESFTPFGSLSSCQEPRGGGGSDEPIFPNDPVLPGDDPFAGPFLGEEGPLAGPEGPFAGPSFP